MAPACSKHTLTEEEKEAYLRDAEECVRQLRARGRNLPHVQYAYVAAALAVIDGRFKFASGKSNLTSAARTFGKGTKSPGDTVRLWMGRLERLARELAAEQEAEKIIVEVMDQLKAMPTHELLDAECQLELWESLEHALTPTEPTLRAGGSDEQDAPERLLLQRTLSSMHATGLDAAGPESLEAVRDVHSREAQVQQKTVVTIDPDGPDMSSGFVVLKNESDILFSASAHGVLDLQRRGANPVTDGVSIGYDAEPIKRHDRRARIVYISFPQDGYFCSRSTAPEQRAQLEASWRNAAGVVVDENRRDLVLLKLSREGEPRLPNGQPLLRAIRFADARTLEGKSEAVAQFGYGQSGGPSFRQSGTNITRGTLTSVDTRRSWLRTSSEILPAHSGGPLVVEYMMGNGHKDFAAVGYAISSVAHELGNCRCALRMA